MYGNLMLQTYRNFIKLIQNKLELKINSVIFRYFRHSFRALWDVLQNDFPNITFKVCKDDDINWQRNVSNTANLLGWLYNFNEVLY